MSLLTIIILAVALAMDAFAVSIASGATAKTSHAKHALMMALAFGLFQAVMPIIGWAAGAGVRDWIKDFDHWIAFGLLSFIGGKMIYESFKIKQAEQKISTLTVTAILVLAIATSIDALAVGFTFSFLLASSVLFAVVVIGVVTFVFSYGGFYIGKEAGHLFESKIEALGGVILIGIGIKILLQHLF